MWGNENQANRSNGGLRGPSHLGVNCGSCGTIDPCEDWWWLGDLGEDFEWQIYRGEASWGPIEPGEDCVHQETQVKIVTNKKTHMTNDLGNRRR